MVLCTASVTIRDSYLFTGLSMLEEEDAQVRLLLSRRCSQEESVVNAVCNGRSPAPAGWREKERVSTCACNCMS